MNQLLLDQIPALASLQRYLEELAIMEPPAPKPELVLESVRTCQQCAQCWAHDSDAIGPGDSRCDCFPSQRQVVANRRACSQDTLFFDGRRETQAGYPVRIARCSSAGSSHAIRLAATYSIDALETLLPSVSAISLADAPLTHNPRRIPNAQTAAWMR
jgi:hypothetical protein